MELISTPPKVAADQPMIFKLKLYNNKNTMLNDYSIPLQIVTNELTNLNDLRVEGFGKNLAEPSFFEFSGEVVTTTIAIYRGPVDFIYDPIVLWFKATCEADMSTAPFELTLSNAFDKDNNGILEFLRPVN